MITFQLCTDSSSRLHRRTFSQPLRARLQRSRGRTQSSYLLVPHMRQVLGGLSGGHPAVPMGPGLRADDGFVAGDLHGLLCHMGPF